MKEAHKVWWLLEAVSPEKQETSVLKKGAISGVIALKLYPTVTVTSEPEWLTQMSLEQFVQVLEQVGVHVLDVPAVQLAHAGWRVMVGCASQYALHIVKVSEVWLDVVAQAEEANGQ